MSYLLRRLSLALTLAAGCVHAEEPIWAVFMERGHTLRRQARLVEAERQYAFAVQIAESYGKPSEKLAISLNNLASLYYDQGKCAEAEPVSRRATQTYETVFGPDHVAVAPSLNNQASSLVCLNRFAEAEPLFRRAITFRGSLPPREFANTVGNFAESLRQQGKMAEAEVQYQEALAVVGDTDGAQRATLLNNMAAMYVAQGRTADAAQSFESAIQMWERHLGKHHPTLAKGYNNLADALARLGKYQDAETGYRRALEIVETSFGAQDP